MDRTGRRLCSAVVVIAGLLGCAPSPGGRPDPAPSLSLTRLLRQPAWARTLQWTLETRRSGEPVTVRHAVPGRIVVLRTYRRRDGRWCRRFRVEAAGHPTLTGFACRDDAGRWRLRPDPFAGQIRTGRRSGAQGPEAR